MARAAGSWLRFDAGGVAFSIDLSFVREIRRLPEGCPVPNVAPWVLGITNLRGRIIALVDPARALGLAPMDPTRITGRCRMVVVESAGGDLEAGLAVDRVRGVVTGAEILPPVDGLPAEMRRHCTGTLRVEDGLAAVLSGDLLTGLRESAVVTT